MSIEKQVIKLIREAGRRNEKCRVFLTGGDFVKFLEEVEPKYKKHYGALVVDESAERDGYANVLYMGVAVCLDAEASESNDR